MTEHRFSVGQAVRLIARFPHAVPGDYEVVQLMPLMEYALNTGSKVLTSSFSGWQRNTSLVPTALRWGGHATQPAN
jgi:hypothetical protein